jgi:prefoldin subunit 5
VKQLQEQQQGRLKTMVDLGSDFYVQAVVCACQSRVQTTRTAPVPQRRVAHTGRVARTARRPDTQWIYVAVGLGFHAQMTLDEAVAFATQREADLNVTIEALTQRVARLKARIKLVLGECYSAYPCRMQHQCRTPLLQPAVGRPVLTAATRFC